MTSLCAGMTLRPLRVLIEQGPVAEFAAIVGANDDVHRSAAAARAAGYPAPPVPPTYPFVMWHWGAHADLQPEPTGDLADLTELSNALKVDGGMMLHGEQEFTYHRLLTVGETVDLHTVVTDVSEKTNKAGRRMRMATVVTEIRGADGGLALTQTSTFICVS